MPRQDRRLKGLQEACPGCPILGFEVPKVDTGNLFVPFYTTKPGGSGIGLALCRQIAEGHGGTLTLENSPEGMGARARLTIPLDLISAEPVASSALPPESSG